MGKGRGARGDGQGQGQNDEGRSGMHTRHHVQPPAGPGEVNGAALDHEEVSHDDATGANAGGGYRASSAQALSASERHLGGIISDSGALNLKVLKAAKITELAQ